MRDAAGSAAAPAARCRNCLRWGSFISIPPSLVSLFDHLVGAGEQRRRDGQADRRSRCQVNDEFNLGRKLYRQIGRLRTFQNLIHEVGGAAKVLAQIDAITDQTAILSVLTETVDRGQSRR